MFQVKRITLILVLLCVAYFLRGQARTEIGANAGLSFYNGDLNESKLFYNPKTYYGFMVKRNFNERYAIRLALKKVNLGIKDANVGVIDQIYGQNSFDSHVWDVVLQTEFNFLPYNPLELKEDFISPYITGGLGLIYVSNTFSMTIPFGLGIKVRIDKRLGIGAEWSFRKTFTDIIDNGIENIITEDYSSIYHNNDWFSVIGVFVTYNISKLRIECPAYN
ncbi:DUF6089 family protein [Bacteroidota bacterium]